MRNKAIIKSIPEKSKDFSPEKLFDKIAKVARKAGIKVVYAALILYYALTDKEVPLASKVIVIGALGYFICPLDIIPDFLGPLGYSDDLFALLYALRTIWGNIGTHTFTQARNRLTQWFDNVKEEEIKLF
ncbi:MAG: DUF1232 domain-containing protein [Muribaculaceae bacterium]|nr:DUF1232 domain-containing protein [Muribaculaceae bacterium]